MFLVFWVSDNEVPGWWALRTQDPEISPLSLAPQLQQTVASQMVNMNMVIVMCGISKVFVGELVEKGVLAGGLSRVSRVSG